MSHRICRLYPLLRGICSRFFQKKNKGCPRNGYFQPFYLISLPSITTFPFLPLHFFQLSVFLHRFFLLYLFLFNFSFFFFFFPYSISYRPLYWTSPLSFPLSRLLPTCDPASWNWMRNIKWPLLTPIVLETHGRENPNDVSPACPLIYKLQKWTLADTLDWPRKGCYIYICIYIYMYICMRGFFDSIYIFIHTHTKRVREREREREDDKCNKERMNEWK